jgi:hypothetical protein
MFLKINQLVLEQYDSGATHTTCATIIFFDLSFHSGLKKNPLSRSSFPSTALLTFLTVNCSRSVLKIDCTDFLSSATRVLSEGAMLMCLLCD